MINTITESKTCSPDSDEDVGKLHNKDMSNEVCHPSSFSCLVFIHLIHLILDFPVVASNLFLFTQVAEI